MLLIASAFLQILWEGQAIRSSGSFTRRKTASSIELHAGSQGSQYALPALGSFHAVSVSFHAAFHRRTAAPAVGFRG